MSGRRLPGGPPVRTDYPRGTRLEAADLRATRDYEAGLLALHVRGAHGGWGIAQGLGARPTADAGAVLVSPGVAFDCHGRALTLDVPTVFRAPPRRVPGQTWSLVLEAASSCGGGSSHDCGGEPRPVRALAELAWRPLAPAGPSGCEAGSRRTAVPLGRFRVRPDGGLADSGDRPPWLRRTTRPPLGAGVAVGSALAWRSTGYHAEAWIDTREAGFATDPVYTVRVHGVPAGVVGPFRTVAFASPQGFRLRLAFGAANGAPAPDAIALSRELTFAWMGVERAGACSIGASLAPHGPLVWNGRPVGLDLLLNIAYLP